MKKEREELRLFSRFEGEYDRLCEKNEPLSVLVALSGGGDSTALLALLARLLQKRGGRVEAYHLNHRIRGGEAEDDCAFCVELCAELGILLHAEERDIPAIARAEKRGLEETARAERYERLEEVRRERGLSFIATAHNAEDQLETVLFRIARGASLKGLCGIPQKRGAIIRPLLSFTGQELREYCMAQGLSFRQDSTNLSDDYARNDLRHHALPAMKRVNSSAAAHGVRMARELKEDEALISSLVPEGRLTRQEMRALHPSLLRRYLAARYEEYCGQAALEGVHLQALCGLIEEADEGASLSLPGLIKVRIFGDGLHFEEDRKKKEDYILPVCGEIAELPQGGGRFFVMDKKRFDEFWVKNRKIHKLFNKEAINSATIKGTLFIRAARKGDRIAIGGMTKKVSALMGEMKIPLRQRADYPLLCDDSGVLWLPGKAPRDESRDPCGDLILGFLPESGENGEE